MISFAAWVLDLALETYTNFIQRSHVLDILFAALIFGFADSLQQKLAILRTPIPSEFLAMAPYLVTIIVVAGIVGNAKPPQAIGQAYVKEN